MKFNYSTFFSRQARKPTGLFGRFYMSKVFNTGNTELNDFVLESLVVSENDSILEIGSGTGVLAYEIANHLNSGIIEGIDFSKAMYKLAKKKNRNHIANGKVKFYLGDFANISFSYNDYDKVFSVNTVYFWTSPQSIILKISELLKPGGKVFIGYHEESEMEQMPLNREVFKYYTVGEMEDTLSLNETLTDIKTISKKGQGKTCYCTIAKKRITNTYT